MAHGNATLRVCQLLRAGHPADALMEYTQKKAAQTTMSIYIIIAVRRRRINVQLLKPHLHCPHPPCTQHVQIHPIRYPYPYWVLVSALHCRLSPVRQGHKGAGE